MSGSAPAIEVDLFGDSYIRRDARFDGSDRLTLTRWWAPGPRACVIGCNPSTADALADDPTSRWWNRWFRLFGFNGYDAVNLYPFCTAIPAECRQIAEAGWQGEWHYRDAMQANASHVARVAKRATQVFVCWGAIAWDDLWVESVVEEVQSGEAPWPDLWCWGTTGGGAPKHPLARGAHRIAADQPPIMWRPA